MPMPTVGNMMLLLLLLLLLLHFQSSWLIRFFENGQVVELYEKYK